MGNSGFCTKCNHQFDNIRVHLRSHSDLSFMKKNADSLITWKK